MHKMELVQIDEISDNLNPCGFKRETIKNKY